ncbi:Thioredoxin/glutathione peroxidase BtuE [Streptomyces tendae]
MTTSANTRNDDSLPLDVEIGALQGGTADLSQYAGRVVLVVNVASKCGLTPQYSGLERLHARYAEQGFTVLGVPCNQFMGQEPGSADEIAEFCSATYGVTFPMTEKVEVNGEGRHPLYDRLTGFADAEGHSGDTPSMYTTLESAVSANSRMEYWPLIPGCAPTSKGSTCTVMCGSCDISATCSSCSRITCLLPTTRCRQASSRTTHSRSGLWSAEMRSCRRMRTCTRFSTSATDVSGNAPWMRASA